MGLWLIGDRDHDQRAFPVFILAGAKRERKLTEF